MIPLPKNLLSYILYYTDLNTIRNCYILCKQFKKAIDNELLWILLSNDVGIDYYKFKDYKKLTTTFDVFEYVYTHRHYIYNIDTNRIRDMVCNRKAQKVNIINI
jgi:hypothetical protein